MAPSPSSKKKSARRLPSYLRHGQGEPVGALLQLREAAQEAARERNRQAETRAASLKPAISARKRSVEPEPSLRGKRGYDAIEQDAGTRESSRAVKARLSKARHTTQEPEPAQPIPAAPAASLADECDEMVEIEVETLADSPVHSSTRSAASAPRTRSHGDQTPRSAGTSEPATAST